MARDITITRSYPIVNGYVQTPPNLEATKTTYTVDDESAAVYSKAGNFYEVETEVL